MKTKRQKQLIQFLVKELSIPDDSIQLAIRHSPASITLLPMVLWQYGLVNIQQLEKIWDWLEKQDFDRQVA